MAWPAFSLRDVLLLLVALVAIYLVVMLLRLVQVGRHSARQDEEPVKPATPELVPPPRRSEPAIQPVEDASAVPASRAMAAYAAAEYAVAAAEEVAATESFAVPPAPTFEWEEVKELFGDELARPAAPQPSPGRSSGFGEHLADHLARSDMEMEVQRMRDEMERMRAEMEELRAARRVSPQYAEAVELAQRGLTAQDVADRLGISLAEAELVQALSRGKQNFDEGDDHGADTNAAGGRRFDEFGHYRNG